MTAIAFRPLGDRYLVEPDEQQDEKTAVGGYEITQKKSIHEQPVSGTVRAKGKSCAELEVGDRVAYGKYSGYDQKLGGTLFKVLRESEILGQLVGPAVLLCTDCHFCPPADGQTLCNACAHSPYRSNT